ncbi:MAG: right-handed parallel beta-helix repeat-containing protein [Bacteroidetes bacterium]|nr:right-handed parallel beta-helix repeat-containing protein [Bacteroidota bacterium]
MVKCDAANYYFSSSTGKDTYTSTQAQSKATPWASITQLNTYFTNIKPGDSILFKCGDTFTGTISITKSGTAALPIILASYGTGPKPIISGFAPVTGWTSLGGNIYQGSCPAGGTTVNVVLLNGVSQQIGRYPNADAANSGYLNIDSHITDTQITSAALNTAVNWAGAQVVIRKNHWTLDIGTISSNTPTVINYTDGSIYQPINNFGFFIQNSPNTLDENGEWYYNATAKTLMMYLTAAPTNTSVQISSRPYLVTSYGQNYITVSGLSITGANNNAFDVKTCNYFQIKNCTISSTGIYGVNASITKFFSITNSVLKDMNNVGVNAVSSLGATISGDSLTNVAMRAGMGQSQNGTYEGIIINGTRGLVSNNYLYNIGYVGIDFRGDTITLQHNFISNFDQVKDDGGAIYTYAANVDSNTNHYALNVLNNIVTTSGGAPNGTTGAVVGNASGIYLDDNSTGVTISGNSVSYCTTGILLHHSRNLIMTNNMIFNNSICQLFMQHNETQFVFKNNVINNNVFYSENKTEMNVYLSTIAPTRDITGCATFTNNYYSPTVDDIFPFDFNGRLVNLQLWQNVYGKDAGSKNTVSLPFYATSMPSKRSMYANSSLASNITGITTWSVNGNFKGAWSATGPLNGGEFVGSFTYNSGSATNSPCVIVGTGAVATTTVYMLKFSMIATGGGNKRMQIYLRNTAAPYNRISEIKYVTIDSLRTENTVMIQPTAAVPAASIVMLLENETITLYLDNIGFYTTVSTPINPATQILYQYNPTLSTVNQKLNSLYVDYKNVSYSTHTAAISGFGSILLFKNQDSTAVTPPKVYAIPIPQDIIAVTPTPKTANVGVYPNPATDYIMLNFNSQDVKDLNIRLVNTKGDIILNRNVEVNSGSYRLDLSQKPTPGCYYIWLNGSGINQSAKVIII